MMWMKYLLTILLIISHLLVKANMASPVMEGSMYASAFSSRDIDILSEYIHISIDKDYKTAKYIVEYTIQSDIAGNQIPLLFYAQDFEDSFYVWVDGIKVLLKSIPDQYLQLNNGPLSAFSNSFPEHFSDKPCVSIAWEKNVARVCSINDLKYFETNISKGKHTIRVEYLAHVSTDRSDWIKKNSFRYSLTPAKYWRSFGSLKVVVEQEGAVRNITTNIGNPLEVSASSSTWLFTKLPGDYLEFSHTPEVNSYAKMLIAIEPFGIACLAGLLLFTLHLLAIYYYRKRNIEKRFSPLVWAGSLIIPILVLIAYIFSYGFIDEIIGEAASKYHGYYFLAIVLYPVMLPVYWTLMWLSDKFIKYKLQNHNH